MKRKCSVPVLGCLSRQIINLKCSVCHHKACNQSPHWWAEMDQVCHCVGGWPCCVLRLRRCELCSLVNSLGSVKLFLHMTQCALLNYSSHRLSAFDSSLGGSRVSWGNQYTVPAYMTASLLWAKTADAFLPRLHIRHMKDHCEACNRSLTVVQTGRN